MANFLLSLLATVALAVHPAAAQQGDYEAPEFIKALELMLTETDTVTYEVNGDSFIMYERPGHTYSGLKLTFQVHPRSGPQEDWPLLIITLENGQEALPIRVPYFGYLLVSFPCGYLEKPQWRNVLKWYLTGGIESAVPVPPAETLTYMDIFGTEACNDPERY